MYREPKRFLPCSEMLNSSLETRRILTASETKLLRLLFYHKHGIRVILHADTRISLEISWPRDDRSFSTMISAILFELYLKLASFKLYWPKLLLYININYSNDRRNLFIDYILSLELTYRNNNKNTMSKN